MDNGTKSHNPCMDSGISLTIHLWIVAQASQSIYLSKSHIPSPKRGTYPHMTSSGQQHNAHIPASGQWQGASHPPAPDDGARPHISPRISRECSAALNCVWNWTIRREVDQEGELVPWPGSTVHNLCCMYTLNMICCHSAGPTWMVYKLHY
jgi:hypothetical protein